MEDLPHILVIDDDARLRDLLRRYLTDNGFRVTTAGDSEEARRTMQALAFDLLVLDVMMPGETGTAFARSLRGDTEESRMSVPILMLTALGETDDRISGLESGADDYLTKPFEPRELLLRIRTILKRTHAAPPDPATTDIQFGGFRFDMERGVLERGGVPVRISPAEASLLKVLGSSAGLPLSREELAERCKIHGNERTIDVQVTRLRRKIETDPRAPQFLQTIRGKGYVLRPD